MGHRARRHALLFCSAAVIGLSALPGLASAEARREFNIPPQSLASALTQFGSQSGAAVVIPGALTSL
ncbi:MAG TPA: hypothetical protein VD906_03560, partial [Caulobacteraceae bacterium]|nr:hypothetical protein [Caulobacteraceae bacterium]